VDYLLISFSALAASALTFYSGFGLGTLLMPVFALYFPPAIAVSLTAVVHLLNNLFKMFLAGKHADKLVVARFGLPAIAAAFLGAWCLSFLTGLAPLLTYEIFGRECTITPLKLIIAVLMIFFAVFETLPFYKTLAFDSKYLPAGGILSGFFGGLSGHQGALRSAFLIRAGLSKEGFIGTGIVIAVLIDLARLSVYSSKFFPAFESAYFSYLAAATAAAFAGAFLGNFYLKKMTIENVQKVVSGMLFLIALLLVLGIL
jgi:uncharacterized protein